MLALAPQSKGYIPDGWIEPTQRRRELGKQLRQRIEPFDVRQLVQHDNGTSLVRPFIGIRGQQNPRMHDTPCHGHAGAIALQQHDWARDLQPAREAPYEGEPSSVIDRIRRPPPVGEANGTYESAEQEHRGAKYPRDGEHRVYAHATVPGM